MRNLDRDTCTAALTAIGTARMNLDTLVPGGSDGYDVRTLVDNQLYDASQHLRAALERAMDAAGRAEEVEVKLDAARQLHRPFGVYTDCGHDHRGGDEGTELGVVTDVDDVGLVCADGKLYDICTECHVADGLGEPEWVAADPDARWPCATIRALDGVSDR